MKEFYDHLIHKYYVFHPLAALDLSNCIDDVCIIDNAFEKPKKKLNEQEIYKHVRKFLEKFRVFKSSDTNFTQQLNTTSAEAVYNNYKQYKQKQKETPVLDPDIDTSDTYYLNTHEVLTTEHLVNTFGELVITGGYEDKHRYEYKFRMGKYIFSVYDWLNECGERESENSITWHIAGNSDSKNALGTFTEYLQTCTNAGDDMACC